MNYTLKQKVAIITGASHGFGLELAKSFAQVGASLILCARNIADLELACNEITTVIDGQRIICHAVDVSKEDECQKFVDSTVAEFGQIDVLVNNAGIYGPKNVIEGVDWLEWVRCIEINLLGSVLMCRAVLPHMKARNAGKIIQLSGGGATKPMPYISAYAASKAAVVRFAETLAEETRQYGIDVNSVAPGALNTRILEEVLEAGPDKVGSNFYNQSLKQKQTGGAGFAYGVNLCLFLASSASDGITGKLISAQWDDYEVWPEHLAELQQGDLYTLRRITGRDRGKKWGDK